MDEAIQNESENSTNPEMILWSSLVEVSRVANSAESVDQVYQALESMIAHLVPHDRLIIRFLNSDLRTVTEGFVTGDELAGWEPGAIHDMHGTATAEVVETGRSVLVEDGRRSGVLDSRPTFKATTNLFPALLAVPMYSRGRLIATLQLRSRQIGYFTAQHQDILESFANHVAPIIENALNVEGLETQARERV